MAPTPISSSAILPKKNPLPQSEQARAQEAKPRVRFLVGTGYYKGNSETPMSITNPHSVLRPRGFVMGSETVSLSSYEL